MASSKNKIPESLVVDGAYVIGVRWRSILAVGNLPARAKKMAKEEAGASHYCHSPEDRYVGMARISVPAPKDGKFYSMAKIFMGRTTNFGVSMAVIEIGDGQGWWVCVTESGNVRIDQICETEADVRSIADGYTESNVGGGQVVSFFGDNSISFPASQGLSFNDLVVVQDDAYAFIPLKAKTDPRIFKLVGFLVVIGGAYMAYTKYQDYKRQVELDRMAAEAAMMPEPEEAAKMWKAALEKAIKAKQVVDHKGLAHLRDMMVRLPSELGGWSTSSYSCILNGNQWVCGATFKRTGKDPLNLPTNAGFMKYKPEGWSVKWVDLGSVQIGFKYEAMLRELDRFEIPLASDFQINSLSHVQSFSAYYNNLTLGEPLKEPVPAPIVPVNGATVPMPEGRSIPTVILKVEASIETVLRNVFLMDARAPQIFWKSVELSIGNKEGLKAASFKSSALQLRMKGEMYALDAK